MTPASVRTRGTATWVATILAALSLSGCREVEEGSEDGYHPSKLEEIEGTDLKRVTFTAEGARRTGLRTERVRRSGGRLLVPYEALIYDASGAPYVYTSPKPLTFLRAPVEVDRVDGERVVLSDGPPPGSEVVTVGASEVYGSELEIEGGH